MIEFIVLGKIPGTEIYITFNWLIIVIISAVIIYDIKTIKDKKNSNSSSKKLTTKTSKPVKYFPRKA